MLEDDKIDILLVDDQPRNLDALEAVLAMPEYNLIRATSGSAALKQVLEREFAVILLDVNMPEMDGFECAQLIKKRWQSQETPIIFLTAVANDLSFIFKGYSSGGVDYITKPFEASVVKAKVAVFVKLFKARRLLRLQLEETRALCHRLEEQIVEGRRDQATLVDQIRELVDIFASRLRPEERPIASRSFMHT